MRSLWNSLGLWRLTTVVAVGAIAVMAFVAPLRLSQSASYIAVMQAQEGVDAGGWIVEIAPDRSVRLSPLGSAQVPPDRSLQFWTVVDQGQGPVALGLLEPDKVNQLKPENLTKIGPDQLFEMSLEPKGGSPTGKPTGPVLFKGTAATAL